LWTVSNGQETSPGPGHTGGVSTLVFSPDGKLAATCSVFDLAVQVWNTATGEIVRTFGDHPVGIDEVQFSPDGRWLATAAWDHPIFVWDLATGRCVQSLADHPSIGPHFRFSADGKSIATTARSETVGVWDCVTGKLLATHAAPPHQVASMLTFADGTMLAIERADDDDAEVSPIALWELTSNRLVRRFAGHKGTVNCAVLSPDGRSLASRGDDQMIRIWEVATGQQRREFHDPGEPTGWVGTQFLAFSPDGRTLASSGSHDSFPRLWRLADGNEFPLLRGHRSWIGAVEFSPDSRRLLTGSQDTTAIVWDLSGHRRSPPARPTGTSEIAQAWEKLAQSDAAVSYAAICTLSEAGDAATDYLRDRLKAIKGASRDQIAEWIHQLDAPQFTVRERATAALIQVVDEAEADLRRAVPRASAEARERIHRILDGIREYARSADRLRQIRTLEVLEGQGTPAARAVLAELGLVNSPSLLAREARQALHRLERRPAD
jgi:WD40 repeat protein